ncbi:MAG: HAD hydrolase-like protein [Alphaproteobacteria bacterium]|nr:HAD hydrolase-like protein [Alphaproteobacteria bacterium]
MSGGPTLAARLDGFAAVTCDVFDTAIRRRLARPEDVHLVTGARLAAAGLTALSPAAFQAARVAAEAVMRTNAEARGEDEPRIAEIYDHLAACAVLRDADAAARVELAAETAVCVAVPEVQAALAGRCVLFVSDSIFPGAWIAELLMSCGYTGDIQVLSSADTRASKHGGRMYPAVLARLGQPAGRVIHIGDNPHSDGAQARAAGLATVAVAAGRFAPELAAIAALDWPARLLHSHRRVEGKVGLHRYASLLAIGWTLDILAAARERGARRIYFCARDGWLPHEIARRILARTGEAIEPRMLAVSRRAVVTPAAGSIEAGLARDYLVQEGFAEPGPRVIVDVGWRGSTQGALAALAEGDLQGCYLGLLPEALRPGITPATTRCALFSFGHPVPLMGRVMDGYALPELFFSAPHGSVLGYERRDGRVEPKFAPDHPARAAAFDAIAEGVLAEFEALDAILAGAWSTMSAATMLDDLLPLLTTPDAEAVRAINAIPFINGPDDTGHVPAINRMPWHEMLLHPGRALRRARDCPWRAGWVRMHLPWPLPAMDYPRFADRARRVGLG